MNLWLLAQDAATKPPIEVPAWFWEAFVGGVVVVLLLDLVVFHRKPHEVRTKEAVFWTIFWIGVALLFNAWVWHQFGQQHAIDFFTAFVVEKSLSVDNLFVFLVIFQYFKVPPPLQHRVLFFGVLGAIVMRFVFILVGIALIEKFEWVMYVFGAFLIYTAVKLLAQKDEHADPSKNWFVRGIQRWLPFVPEYHGSKFTVKLESGKRVGTLLLLVVLVIEATDVAFAVDSIPAVIGITQEQFIVFTSNVCAILGLRAIYFLLARFMDSFRYLKAGLAMVLAYVGLKMFGLFHVGSAGNLAIIGGILTVATVASILHPEKKAPSEPPTVG